MSSPPVAPRSRLLGGFALLLAACPPPLASEDTGEALTSSSSTSTSPGDSASDTGATPTSGVDPTSTGAPLPDTPDTTGTTDTADTTLGVGTTTGDMSTTGSTGDPGTTGSTSDPGTTGTTSTTSTTDTTSDTGTTGTGDSSSTGPGVEPPPGCDLAVVHVGDLAVTDDTVMEDLQCIVEVTGRLRVRDTKTLVSFAELGNLKRVGDDVEVFDNLALVDLDGLAGLERVDGGMYGQLKIHHNPTLTDVTGLKSLKRVDSLRISSCDALTDLTGLTGDIDGILAPTWGLVLHDNAGLTDLAGLTGLTGLDGSIAISGHAQLTDISALSTVLNPTIVQIAITDNPALQDLHGLELVVASQIVYVRNNDSLIDLSGLDGLQAIEPHGLMIDGNAQMMTLDGLDALATVTEMIIEDNPKLASLAALANLTHVAKGIELGRCDGPGNDSLVDLHGLEGLVKMTWILINENDALQSMAALPAGIGLKGIEAFNNPLLPHAELADYVADAGIGQLSHLCNNGGAPAVCECIVVQD